MSAKPDTAAPTGRKKPAQGKERSDDALGHASKNISSPDGAKDSVGWPVVKSGELLSFVTSGSRGWAKYYAESGPLFLRIGNLDHDSVALDLRDLQRVAPPAGAEGTRTKVQASDILISITADVGMIGLVPSTLGEAYINQHVAMARPLPTVHPPYLAWCLTSPKAQRQFLQLQRGATKVGLGLDDIRAVDVPLPPLPEQRRIVAEIEKQFTRLEAGVAALRRVQANLKRYRAAVLKAACEGRLVPTEAALARSPRSTKNGPPAYETGEALLARILTERRQNWQGRGQYKEPAAPDVANPLSVPEGWACASVDQITENFDGRRVPLKSADRDKRSGQYPYYGASGIIDDIDDFLFDGDYLLIGEDGANLLSRSTPIAFKATGKFWVNNHAHIVQTRGGIPLSYLSIFLNGKDLSFSVTGSAQPKLTQAALNKIPVPLPPLAEQTRIVAEVERRLSVVERGGGAGVGGDRQPPARHPPPPVHPPKSLHRRTLRPLKRIENVLIEPRTCKINPTTKLKHLCRKTTNNN